MSKIKLIIFDLDGTLVHSYTSDFQPGVRYWLSHGHRREKLAICTNQGGIGLRHWREVVRAQGGDIGDPNSTGWTQSNMEERINALAAQLNATPYISYAYQSKKGHWSPTPEGSESDPRWSQSWRKPQPGMLLQAMADANVTPDQTLMVGNSDDDAQAAAAAGCYYSDHDDFFAPYRPHIIITYNPDRCWMWLDLTDGINREATMRRYEAMLQRAAQIYGHTVEIKTKQSRTYENVRLIRAESPEHEARIIELVHGHIADRWIDREWIEFDTPEQHLDALIASDAIQQIVIASIVLRNIYGNDVTERCAAKFAEAEAHKRKFKIVLG